VSVSGGSSPAACVRAIAVVAVGHPGEFAGEFALVEHDLEHRVRAGVAGEVRERIDAERSQRGERRALLPRVRLLDQRVHRARRPFAHGDEQIGLVSEVPVDRTARHAGLGGDLRKRGAGHPPVAEHALGGVEQALARGGGSLTGSSDHRRRAGRSNRVEIPVANVHECM